MKRDKGTEVQIAILFVTLGFLAGMFFHALVRILGEVSL